MVRSDVQYHNNIVWRQEEKAMTVQALSLISYAAG